MSSDENYFPALIGLGDVHFQVAQQHYQTLLKLYQNAKNILPLQKARTRLAILNQKKPRIKITPIAQE